MSKQNEGGKLCPACKLSMEASAWKCARCQHSLGWRSLITFLIPILSLLVAISALFPDAYRAAFPPRGNLFFKVESKSDSKKKTFLHITLTNTGKSIVRAAQYIECADNKNTADVMDDFSYSLRTSQAIVIAPTATEAFDFRLLSVSRGNNQTEMASQEDVYMDLKQLWTKDSRESIIVMDCTFFHEDDVGSIIPNDNFRIWLRERAGQIQASGFRSDDPINIESE